MELAFKLPQPMPKEISRLLLINLLATIYSDANNAVPPKSLIPTAIAGKYFLSL